MASGSEAYRFPSLGPALIISMGYIDLGKWVAAVEVGARFGYDLIMFVLFFNLAAILCQYMAICVGVVTGKNLAQICSNEYSKSACQILGVQAELSMIISDLTMILGIAHGLNLLLGADLLTCLCLAAFGDAMLHFFLTLSGKQIAEAVYVSTAGFALVLYVLGVLVSQPEIHLAMNIFTPNLSGESAHLLMALLGASIMAHNFYAHSAMVQEQRQHAVHLGALFHDHFFAILFIFTGIFLVNYVLMNSAAAFFSSTQGVFNFQDVSLLMDQIFRTPVAPIAFLFVLLLSSQITASTWTICRQLVLQKLFGSDFSFWHHHMLVKAASIISASICASIAGSEGVYQLLIVCQVIQAMLLPSSVIPLFRIASSKLIMGTFKIPWYLEILALLSFLGILASNIAFLFEILFGSNSWINNLREVMGNAVLILYVALIFSAFTSIAFTLYLAVTPLKSASEMSEANIWPPLSQKDPNELCGEPEDNDPYEASLNEFATDDNHLSPAVPFVESSTVGHRDKSISDISPGQCEETRESLDCFEFVHEPNVTSSCTNLLFPSEELKSVPNVNMEIMDKVLSVNLSDVNILQINETKSSEQMSLPSEADFVTEKVEVISEPEESAKGSALTSNSEDSISENSENANVVKDKSLDVNPPSGSLSRLSGGLGRALRRQLAAILDEFWGHLFDFHGKLTPEASSQKLDVVLGLDVRTIVSSVKLDGGTESSRSSFPEAGMGAVLAPNSIEYGSPKHKVLSDMDLAYRGQMGSASWTQRMPALNMNMQSSSSSLLAPIEKHYSSLNLPQYTDSHDYQPATIHGYQLASYLKTMNATRNPYSNITLDPYAIPKLSAPLTTNTMDSLLYPQRQSTLTSTGLSGLQGPSTIRDGRMQADRPFYDPSLAESSENAGSTYTKKYHSSPDISAIIAAGRNSVLNEVKRGGPIGPRSSLGRMSTVQGHYVSPISPPGFHRDVLPPQTKVNPDMKSLWSKQPYEQLFGGMNTNHSQVGKKLPDRLGVAPKETSFSESEYKLLQALRVCIVKLVKLEGSDWLFRQNGGFDEELIDQLAASEKHFKEADGEMNQLYASEHQYTSDRKLSLVNRNEEPDKPYTLSVIKCGEGCIWRASLVVSFGVWCIRRVLELSLVESRPELWGKYTYVLNRLQGILDIAFSKPRQPLASCLCIEAPLKDRMSYNQSLQSGQLMDITKPVGSSFTNASMILEIIKEVEISVSGRKGRTGTAAGDIAFPKGKENLASVLKRYKRRLSNKFPAGQEGNSVRNMHNSVS